MGANTMQAWGVAVFLIAFVLIAGGLAGGGVLLEVPGLVLVAASAGLFLKAKPWEQSE